MFTTFTKQDKKIFLIASIFLLVIFPVLFVLWQFSNPEEYIVPSRDNFSAKEIVIANNLYDACTNKYTVCGIRSGEYTYIYFQVFAAYGKLDFYIDDQNVLQIKISKDPYLSDLMEKSWRIKLKDGHDILDYNLVNNIDNVNSHGKIYFVGIGK